jgi:uncharacterized protein YpmB
MELNAYQVFYLKKIFKWLRIFTLVFIANSVALFYYLYDKSANQQETITTSSEHSKFDKNRNGCN